MSASASTSRAEADSRRTNRLSWRKRVWMALAAMMIVAGGAVGAVPTVIYDMQTDANLGDIFDNLTHPILRRINSSSTPITAAGCTAPLGCAVSGSTTKTISVTNRSSNGHGVAVSVDWIKTHLANNPGTGSYVVNVTGTLGDASGLSMRMRIRDGGWAVGGSSTAPSGVAAETNVPTTAGGAFTITRNIELSEVNGFAASSAYWLTTNGGAADAADIVITGLTIAAVPPPSQTTELVIFDMQTDPLFPNIGRGTGTGSGQRDHHPMFNATGGGAAHPNANSSGAIIGTQPNLAYGVANMTGTSQSLMINIAALGIKANQEVKFEIVGTHTAASGTAQLRTENGITQRTFGGAPITGNAFSISTTVSGATIAADIAQAAAGRYGVNVPAGDAHTITTLRITKICQLDDDDCEPDAPPVTPFVWGAPGGPTLHGATNATANRGNDVSYIVHNIGVTGVNLNPAVLRFNNVVNTDEDRDVLREAGNSMLTLAPSSSLNRVLHVWTDLSAEVPGATGNGNAESLEFITTASQTAGAILGPVTGLNPIEITIPINLLYRPAAGGQPEKFANAIYVLTTLASTNLTAAIADPPALNSDGRFRRDVTEAINHAVLTMVPPPPFNTNISLNYGINAAQMSFTWWTPKGEAAASRVQLVPASQLISGEMPPSPQTFNGAAPSAIPSTLPAYAFDVNRVTAAGLSPNTEYAYRVGDGTPDRWSEVYTFRTFTPNDGHTAIVVSDPQISSGAVTRMRGAWSHTLSSAVTRANAAGGASLMISAGDNVAYANDVVEFDAYLYPPELRSLPVFTTVGNHDAVDQRSGAGYQENLSLLPLVYTWPNHDWLGGSPTGTNQLRGGGNHYFSHGNTLYISLNTNINPTPQNLATHKAFIEKAVATHPGAVWKIAAFHHDIFGNGNGHSAGMVASGRQALGAILNEAGIDFVINGHDHTHSRSLFMNGTTVVQEQKPVDFMGNTDGKLVFEPHPGTFVDPKGIVYMTLGSPADFPKYSSIIPMQPWVAYTDPEEHDNYAQYSIMKIDGNSLTFETYVIPYTTGSNREPTGAPEVMHSSITLRKNATFDDLQELIAGAESLPRGDITQTTWNAFQTAITSAKTVGSGAGAGIHTAFINIYDRYYDLQTTANNALLNALVEEVADTLGKAVEGLWAGQYPAGSIAVLRAVFEVAAEVNDNRLSTQTQIDEQYGLLTAAFSAFLAGAGTIPRPWIDIHEIPASGVYTMGLVDWMDESVRLNTHWDHPNYWPRYFAHNTKRSFSGGTFGQSYTTFDAAIALPGGTRTETPFAPANAMGGRRVGIPQASTHVTRTHVGEWIRYELNVAQAGEYKVELGAINPNAAAMAVLLRDLNYNTLATFNIPANHGAAGNWTAAAMIPASGNIYLPQGKFIIEMVFMNSGASAVHNGSGNPSTYADGPDVDILTFERVGAGTPPVWNRPANHFILPLPPNDAAGNAPRQRGWGTNGVSNEWGSITESPLTARQISAATHLVFEVAARPTGNVDVVLTGNAAGFADPHWNQQTYSTAGTSATGHNAVYDADLRTYTIDLSLHPAYDPWRNSTIGRIIVAHTNDTWDEMNVITAYLVLDNTYVPPVINTVTVISEGTGSTGGGSYEAGNVVTVNAGTAPEGRQFKNWTSEPAVTFANANSAATTFTMPAGAVTVTAVFENMTTTSILSSNRGPNTVSPQGDAAFDNSVLTGEFTAGPNPAAKSAGEVKFFRHGKKIQSASLKVFDASGNVVNKVRIIDGATVRLPSAIASDSRRIVGSWDLRDQKGRQVSEGTYLVKGTITVDGKKERISLMIGIR